MLSEEELIETIVLNHLIKYNTIEEDILLKQLIDNGLAKPYANSGAYMHSIYNLVLKFKRKGVRLLEKVNPFILSEEAITFSKKLLTSLYDENGNKIGDMFLHPRLHRSELI
jgi:hypothetical protein|tara:strand:- start:3580 stop:3915 length:336 start_codon:yes stop_codon:yes gene_type:complete